MIKIQHKWFHSLLSHSTGHQFGKISDREWTPGESLWTLLWLENCEQWYWWNYQEIRAGNWPSQYHIPVGACQLGVLRSLWWTAGKKLIGPEKAYMFSCIRWWPCWGLRKRRRRPKCIMGDSCCSITFITNSCVLCPQTDSDNGISKLTFKL